MIDQDSNSKQASRVRTIKDLVNTPFKRAMFVVQIISYVLIVGSPFMGGFIGRLLGLKAAQTGGVILGIARIDVALRKHCRHGLVSETKCRFGVERHRIASDGCLRDLSRPPLLPDLNSNNVVVGI